MFALFVFSFSLLFLSNKKIPALPFFFLFFFPSFLFVYCISPTIISILLRRAVISAVGENLVTLGDVGFKNIESILTEAASSPDPQILAGIYYVEEDEMNEAKLRKDGKFPTAIVSDKGSLPPVYTEDQVFKALQNIVQLPPDRLLLRWMKYRCRLGYSIGVSQQRKVENFGQDLRDGIGK